MTAEIILKEVRENIDEIIAHRRAIHKIPGTGFDIADTVEYVRKALNDMGVEAKKCGKAGLTATIGQGGKVFLLRADMDALPIKEESGLEFASDNGCMHACGHDLHTAMLLGAAKILKAHEAELKGTVKLMFQPAEEVFEGALDMINDGVLADPKPDAAAMIHVIAGMPMETGTVVVSAPGVSLPAADYFEIHIQGKGCHGSMPSDGIDPITVAAHTVINLQEISARELSTEEKAVLTFGRIHAGEASNVVPDTAFLGGTLRTYDEKLRTYIKERMATIVEGTANIFRAKAELCFTSGCPSLYNDPELVKFATENLRKLPGLPVYPLSSNSGGGSEDFAYISRQIPALMLSLAAGKPEEGYLYPQHHPQVKFDEKAMEKGTAAFVQLALSWLEENE